MSDLELLQALWNEFSLLVAATESIEEYYEIPEKDRATDDTKECAALREKLSERGVNLNA